jgi:uncharacterized pyridoxamine 5'-phosphate oxidase family protein
MSTVSNLIASLNAIYAQHGDVSVVFATNEGAALMTRVSAEVFTENSGLYMTTNNANAQNVQIAAFIE